ncbi:MAG: YceI family protein [Actinomycetota bacterium]|nr:YceI family protein [Actinomycetota bacterium]
MKLVKWLLIAIGAAVVVVVGGTFVYINFIRDDPPPKLSFEERDSQTSTTLAATDDTAVTEETDSPEVTAEGVDGTWTISTGSEAGYRASENLFGQDAVAVGRTEAVTGSIAIAGTSVIAGSFTVDMTTVESDQDNRDRQFRNRIMETDEFPTSTFELTLLAR